MTYGRPGSVSRLGPAAVAAIGASQPSEKTIISMPIKFWVAPRPLRWSCLIFLSPSLCVTLCFLYNLLIPLCGHATPGIDGFLMQPTDRRPLSIQNPSSDWISSPPKLPPLQML